MHAVVLRRVVGVASAIGGSTLVLGVVLGLNDSALDHNSKQGVKTIDFEVAPKKKPPPTRPKPKPKPKKKARRPAAPIPNLGVSLSGVDFGLPGLGDALADATTSLIGDVDDVVMTEDSVDDLPVPIRRMPPPYPARAKAKGITGFVDVSLVIDASGRVSDVQIMEASPPGIFEDGVLATVKSWSFQPAMYQGQAVPIRVRLNLRFEQE